MQLLNKLQQLPQKIRAAKWFRLLRLLTKKIFIPGFERVPLYDVIKFFIKQVNTVGLNQRAAAISYNSLLAIPAAFIFIFTLIPYFPALVKNNIANEINLLAKSISPTPTTEAWVSSFIKDFVRTGRSALLSTGLFVVLFASSNAIMGIMTSFNGSLTELRKRNFLQLRFTAIKITLCLFILLLITVLILIGEDYLFKYYLSKTEYKSALFKNILMYLRWVQILVLIYLGIGFVYKYAPQQHVRWKILSPGSILATFLTVATYIIFSWYLKYFGRYNEIYGSVGTVIIIMVLIYFNALVLLIGFELNVAIYAIKNKRNNLLKNNTEPEIINLNVNEDDFVN
jgi:membrane protein